MQITFQEHEPNLYVWNNTPEKPKPKIAPKDLYQIFIIIIKTDFYRKFPK